MGRQSRCPGCKELKSAHDFGRPGKYCTGPGARFSKVPLFKAEQDAAPEKNALTESNAAPGKHAAELFATKENAGPQRDAAPESYTAPGKNATERIVWSPGTRVVGKYDFKGRTREDLPFKKGEILIIETVTRVSPYENLAKLFGIAYGTGKKVYFRATSCL
ncbi:hypothetical protein AWC38_SpisGene23150 [Stylophora pistillata]|uniref:Uncharacterized protein n=1 Tax=Stylophora pistillata TaxID=50429 RepID=A0A2B4R8W7_STYPI|nr:hypothetical protein AWC38_SpisGene23150 [Stylophora pistillata]